jgi:hypothetical protein
MPKKFVLASCILILGGCMASQLSPTTYRCADTPGFPLRFNEMTSESSYRLLPGVEPGMTRGQVRSIFEELRQDPQIAKGVTLDDSDPEYLYFLAGTCPHLRYRFQNNRLVAAARVGKEAGFWTYIGRNFTETRCDMSQTRTGEWHWIRTVAKYDQHGNFIGTEKIDDGPTAKGSPGEYRVPANLSPEEVKKKKEEMKKSVPLAERDYCKCTNC